MLNEELKIEKIIEIVPQLFAIRLLLTRHGFHAMISFCNTEILKICFSCFFFHVALTAAFIIIVAIQYKQDKGKADDDTG